jgi:hypothetical protein
METAELILRSDHPPHRVSRHWKGYFFLRIIHRALISLLLLFLFSHLPFVSPGVQFLGDKIEEVGQGGLRVSGMKELLTFFSPGLQRKQEALREIIEVLE